VNAWVQINKYIAVGAQGTISMMGKKKTCLTVDGKENGLGANCDSFGFAQFAAWENRFEQMSHSFYDYGPCDALRRGAFLFVLNL